MNRLACKKKSLLSMIVAFAMILSLFGGVGTSKQAKAEEITPEQETYNYTELQNGQIIRSGDTLVNDISGNSVNITILDRNYGYYGSIASNSSMVFENSYTVKDDMNYRIESDAWKVMKTESKVCFVKEVDANWVELITDEIESVSRAEGKDYYTITLDKEEGYRFFYIVMDIYEQYYPAGMTYTNEELKGVPARLNPQVSSEVQSTSPLAEITVNFKEITADSFDVESSVYGAVYKFKKDTDVEGKTDNYLLTGAAFFATEKIARDVTVEDTENGTVTATVNDAPATKVEEVETVYLTFTPEDGYEVGTVSVKDTEGNEIFVEEDGSFLMPRSAVTISVTFAKEAPAPATYNYTELQDGQIIRPGDTLVNDSNDYPVIRIIDRNYQFYYGNLGKGESMKFENSYAYSENYRIESDAWKVMMSGEKVYFVKEADAVWTKLIADEISSVSRTEDNDNYTVTVNKEEGYRYFYQVVMDAYESSYSAGEAYTNEKLAEFAASVNTMVSSEVQQTSSMDDIEENFTELTEDSFYVDSSLLVAIIKVKKDTDVVGKEDNYLLTGAVYFVTEKIARDVTVEDTENGTVTAVVNDAPATKVEEVETVYLTLTPEDGYEVGTVSVKDAEGNEIFVEEDGSFLMPRSAVTISVTFAKEAPAPATYNYTELQDGQIIRPGDTLVNDSGQYLNMSIMDRHYRYSPESIMMNFSVVFENSYAAGENPAYRIESDAWKVMKVGHRVYFVKEADAYWMQLIENELVSISQTEGKDNYTITLDKEDGYRYFYQVLDVYQELYPEGMNYTNEDLRGVPEEYNSDISMEVQQTKALEDITEYSIEITGDSFCVDSSVYGAIYKYKKDTDVEGKKDNYLMTGGIYFAAEKIARDVTVEDTVNGTVTATINGESATKVEEVETVCLTITPEDGYEVGTVSVKDAEGNEITVEDGSFLMPRSAVTISVTFAKAEEPVEAAFTYSYAYDCWRDPVYPIKGDRVYLHNFSNPLKADGISGKWELVDCGKYDSSIHTENIAYPIGRLVSDLAGEYNTSATNITVYALKKDGKHICYGVVCTIFEDGVFFIGTTWDEGGGYYLCNTELSYSDEIYEDAIGDPNNPLTPPGGGSTPEPEIPTPTPEVPTPTPEAPTPTPEAPTPTPEAPTPTPEAPTPTPEEPTTTPEPEEPTTTPTPEAPTPTPEAPTPTPEAPTPTPEDPTTTPKPEDPTTTPEPEDPTTTPEPEDPTTTPEPEDPTTTPEPEEPTTTPTPEAPTPTPEAPTPTPEAPTPTPEAPAPSCSHNWTTATCESYSYCRYCGAWGGSALGHDWNEATCTEAKTCDRCGETVGEALGHDWSGKWTIIKEATATEEGKQELLCARDCGQKKVVTVPATGVEAEPDDNGNLEKDAEVAPEAPIQEVTLDNQKSELVEASGIFTEKEKKEVENGVFARVWIEISKTNEDGIVAKDKAEIEKEAEKIMGEMANVNFFDAELFKQVGDGDKTQISEPGIGMKITIKIPENLQNHDKNVVREYKILRLHDGVVDVLEGIFDALTGEFSFESDKFSTYAIAYIDTPVEDVTEPEDGEDDVTTPEDGGEDVTTPEDGGDDVTKPEESDKDEKDDVPKTGEGANAPLMWTLLLLLAAAIAVYGKKWQERHEE